MPSDTRKTRGILLVDEMLDLSIAARDDRNPAAAEHARRLMSYMQADPRFNQFMKEASNTSLNTAETKAALQGIAERTHQRALGKVAADGNDPALQREANQLFERINRQGDPNAGYTEPRIPTADQQGIVDRYYKSNGVDISRVVRTPHNPDVKGGFLETIQDLQKKIEANPNGEDAKFAARVMADPRYMANVEHALANSGLPESTQRTLRQVSQTAHDAMAMSTRFNPPDDATISRLNGFYSHFRTERAAHIAATDTTPQVNPVYGGLPQASPVSLQADTSTTTPHTIERGESLWKIAQNHYGLTDPKQIQAAVENIAGANGLDQRTVAALQVGREIKLPDSPSRAEGSPSLDWAAMDRDAGKLRGAFRTEATASASVVQPENPAVLASAQLAAAAPPQIQDFSRRSGSAFDRMTV